MPDPPIAVRPMRPREAAQVSALMREVIAALEFYTPAARRAEIARHAPELLRAMAADDPDAVLVAARGEALGGFCVSNDDDGLRWLAWYGVRPEWYGQGAGVLLLEALAERMRARGYHKIWCDCRTENLPSQATLRRADFREICTLRNHWYGQDFLLLERLL
jgi:RimJ/RimL family protein N-acetyltransferase